MAKAPQTATKPGADPATSSPGGETPPASGSGGDAGGSPGAGDALTGATDEEIAAAKKLADDKAEEARLMAELEAEEAAKKLAAEEAEKKRLADEQAAAQVKDDPLPQAELVDEPIPSRGERRTNRTRTLTADIDGALARGEMTESQMNDLAQLRQKVLELKGSLIKFVQHKIDHRLTDVFDDIARHI